MSRNDISCGRVCGCVEDIQSVSDAAVEAGFCFICCCVSHPRCTFDPQSDDSLPAIDRPDLLFTSKEWGEKIVSVVPAWVDVDSSDDRVRRLSEKTLEEELAYASYLSLTVVLLRLKPVHVNLARIVNTFVQTTSFTAVWLIVPAVNSGAEGEGDGGQPHPWELWNSFRTLADNHRRVNLVLEVTPDLPDKVATERWLGEPVRCLWFDTSVFVTKKNGQPALSQAHQKFVHHFYGLDVQAMIAGSASVDGEDRAGAYREYLNWMWRNQPELDSYASFARGYEDFLQVPLQPLCDHLESQIYETFEKDPVKYAQYENAAEAALIDRKQNDGALVVVMVLGSGRGPLVTAVLKAAARAQANVKVYAVEKNPNAVITLRHLQRTKWAESDVEVIHTDMRTWRPPHKADIVVSELLGSFGDNELSPECLEGARHLLKDDTISIPQSYSSYICPMQSERLYTQIRDFVTKGQNRNEIFDTGYVVRVHNRYEIGIPQPVFTFDHPDPNFESKRYQTTSFRATQKCVIHGLLGFFESTLYKDVKISTNPATHSPGMFSWFPILFPLREPVVCREDEEIKVHFWRLKDATKLWYEWCLSTPQATPLQNTAGAVYKMMLF